jgi:N-acetylgalactosamine-6-sulfatase
MRKDRGELLVFLTLFLAFLSITPSAAQQNKNPNIIFIFADDLGWGDLSCYGNDRIETPELDKLADEGTLFTQFYVAGSVCSPSRAGIMTGQYPARNRIFGHLATKKINERREMPNALDPAVFTLTDMLKSAGYATAHLGKWHLGNIPPTAYGIDYYRTDDASNVADEGPLDIWNYALRPSSTKDIFDAALQFIDGVGGQPFYANVWLTDMHATLNPSQEQMDRVTEQSRWNQPIPGVNYSGVEQVYFAALLEMDKQIGLFLERLKQKGLDKNTLIIFSSDNGPEDYQINNSRHSGVGSAGPFRGRKRSIYEGGIRVPFILKWPGKIEADNVNDSSVINGVDFLPTIASLIGQTLPDSLEVDGENMSDVWLGSNRKRTQELYWEWRYAISGHIIHRSPMIAMRKGDYKILVNPDGSRMELYNVVADPSELSELSRLDPERAKLMAASAMQWFSSLPQSPWDDNAGDNQWSWPINK